MVNVICGHCGARFVPYGDYDNYSGPVPCVDCHKSTWVSIVDREVVESKRWPFDRSPG